MEKEEIPVGGYVPLGGIRAYCVDGFSKPTDCELCVFEGTERCDVLICTARERSDNKDVLFTIKLNK